ncbi:UNVERIFIED_ORG: hypothetical protein GGE64_000311 [Rhizobium etli]
MNDALMNLGILSQIEAHKVKAEDVDGALEAPQFASGDLSCAIGDQGFADRCQVFGELGRAQIAGGGRHRLANQFRTAELPCSGRQASIHARDRQAIRLVPALLRSIGRVGRKPLEFLRDFYIPIIQRKFGAKAVEFSEIEGENPLALQPERFPEGLAVDKRVAIPVAADPGTHAQEWRQRVLSKPPRRASELIFETLINFRDNPENGAVVIGQAIEDFIHDLQSPTSQAVRLPKGRRRSFQICLISIGLLRGQAGLLEPAQALCQLLFDVDHALSPNLGRMRRENRRDDRFNEQLANSFRLYAGGGQDRQRSGNRPRHGGFAIGDAEALHPGLMSVFCNVHELRELAERADHALEGAGRHVCAEGGELLVQARTGLSAAGNRESADLFHNLAGLLAVACFYSLA